MKSIQPRFANGIYRDCKRCGGKGCLSCKAEADKEYKRQFPDGPKPIATFSTSNPEDMQKAAESVGAKSLNKAFGPGGGGMSEILDNLRKVGKLEI